MPRNIKVSLFLDRRNSFFLSVNFTEKKAMQLNCFCYLENFQKI